MPVVIKYVVERDGIEKMTFTSKAEADAYDKLLETADALYELLDESQLAGDHQQKEALSMFLAEHKEALLDALGNKRKSLTKKKKQPSEQTKTQEKRTSTLPLEDLVIEPDEDAVYNEDDTSVSYDTDEVVEEYLESDAA